MQFVQLVKRRVLKPTRKHAPSTAVPALLPTESVWRPTGDSILKHKLALSLCFKSQPWPELALFIPRKRLTCHCFTHAR